MFEAKRFPTGPVIIATSLAAIFGLTAYGVLKDKDTPKEQPLSAEEINANYERFQQDFAQSKGTKLVLDKFVTIEFEGDFFTPPTEGLRDGGSVPLDTPSEIDFIPATSASNPNCKTLGFPLRDADYEVTVVVNNNTEPVIARLNQNSIEFCNLSTDIPASVGFIATLQQ